MLYKQIILLFVAGLVALLFFCIPCYRDWLSLKILNEHVEISEQSKHTDIEYRMLARFGEPYQLYKEIAGRLRDNPMILLPPNRYVHLQQGEKSNDIATPEIFYYFTGMRSVIASSPNVGLAHFAITVGKKKFTLVEITTPHYLDSLVTLYKPYLD